MKKLGVLALLGLAAAALGIYVTGALHAQPGAVPAISRTRVAVVNIQEVLKNYTKFKALQEEGKSKVAEFEGIMKKKSERVESLQKQYREAATPQQKEQIEAQLNQEKFAATELKNKWQKDMMKLSNERMTQLYFEMDAVVRDYAKTNGIDLVVRFNEDWNKDTYNQPEFVVQRLNQPIWPMYFDPSLNITNQVLDGLNRRISPTGG